jgi:hypothetical protein
MNRILSEYPYTDKDTLKKFVEYCEMNGILLDFSVLDAVDSYFQTKEVSED